MSAILLGLAFWLLGLKTFSPIQSDNDAKMGSKVQMQTIDMKNSTEARAGSNNYYLLTCIVLYM